MRRFLGIAALPLLVLGCASAAQQCPSVSRPPASTAIAQVRWPVEGDIVVLDGGTPNAPPVVARRSSGQCYFMPLLDLGGRRQVMVGFTAPTRGVYSFRLYSAGHGPGRVVGEGTISAEAPGVATACFMYLPLEDASPDLIQVHRLELACEGTECRTGRAYGLELPSLELQVGGTVYTTVRWNDTLPGFYRPTTIP